MKSIKIKQIVPIVCDKASSDLTLNISDSAWLFKIKPSNAFLPKFISEIKIIEFVNMLYSKTCVKGPLSNRPQIGFKTNYCIMQFKSIAECSKGSILSIFRVAILHRFYYALISMVSYTN